MRQRGCTSFLVLAGRILQALRGENGRTGEQVCNQHGFQQAKAFQADCHDVRIERKPVIQG